MSNDQMIQCEEIIHSACMTAIGIGADAVTVLQKTHMIQVRADLPIGPVQTAMVMALSRVFGRTVEEEQAFHYIEYLSQLPVEVDSYLQNSTPAQRIERLGWLAVGLFSKP